jgi:hypothetical protein
MALVDTINTKRPEKDLVEKKMSEREMYLLKSLLYLLLYTGKVKAGDGGLLFTGADTPNAIPFNMPIG